MNKSDILFEAFKKTVNDKIDNLRLDLVMYDGFLPAVVSSTLTGVKEAEINFDNTSKDEASSLLREYAKCPEVKAIALIFMADTVALDPGEKRILPENLKDDPDMIEAIMAYIHTKEKSEYRKILYKKNKGADNDYWFGDSGWKDTGPMTGRFANPFKA
jgi:hypothetical protein